MGRYKQRHLLHFWVDYIKAIINSNNCLLLNWLSDNSNFLLIDLMGLNFQIQKIENPKFRKFFSIQFNWINVAFIWIEWIKKGIVRANDMLEISWQGFLMFWIEFFYSIMQKFNFEFIKFKRFDICMDIDVDINYFYDEIINNKHKKKITREYKNHLWKIESFYFWKLENELNNYQCTRIYNKILDSEKKNKLFLYEKYKNEDWTYKDVTRFEVEIREDLAKFYKYDDLNNLNIIFAKLVKTFYIFNWQFFKFIEFDNFLNYSEERKREFLKNVEDYKKEQKKANKEIIEIIKSWNTDIEVKTSSQNTLKNIIIWHKNIQKYWKQIEDPKKKNLAITCFLSYAWKLLNSWYTKEQLFEMINTKFE